MPVTQHRGDWGRRIRISGPTLHSESEVGLGYIVSYKVTGNRVSLKTELELGRGRL